MNLTFRSSSNGTAAGFMALIINDIEVAGCTKKKRQVEEKWEIPENLYQAYGCRPSPSIKLPVRPSSVVRLSPVTIQPSVPLPVPCVSYYNHHVTIM